MKNKFSVGDAVKIVSWNMHRILVGRKKFKPPLSGLDPVNPDLAVCVIAVGPQYLEMAGSMIRSLRVNGGFTGPVYIFSDNCCHLARSENVHMIRIPSGLSGMGIKQYKTWLPECVPFRYLLYIDADILIGKSMDLWIKTAKEAAERAPLVLFWDHASTGEYYHGGVIFLNRRVGRNALLKWRRQIWFKGYSRDQKALGRSIRTERDVHLMPGGSINFLSQTGGELNCVAVFNHITEMARRSLEPEKRYIFQQRLEGTVSQNQPV
jgi:hypothetical protein